MQTHLASPNLFFYPCQIKVETRQFQATESGGMVDLQLLSSSYHVEFSPCDVGNKDVAVVQQARYHIDNADIRTLRNFI
jgi:hypothetical protein